MGPVFGPDCLLGGFVRGWNRLALLKNKTRRVATRLGRLFLSRDEIVVSLTSYPRRINSVHRVVRSLFAQTMLPDRIVLYLSRDEFPNGEGGLPRELLACRGHDFKIRWVEGNMRSHKKYLYAVRDYPNALVITVDDDIECRNTLVSELVEAHHRFPHAVCGVRCHVINFTSEGSIAAYNKWILESGNHHPRTLNHPSMRLFPTSGAGMLLPPGSLPPQAFDEEAIKETCLNADDIWLKVMTALAGWPSLSIPGWQGVTTIEGTQEDSLWSTNAKGGNNRAISALRQWCLEHLGVSIDNLFKDDALDDLLDP